MIAKINETEKKIIKNFIKMPIPKYVYEYEEENFDLLDCYEIAFTFANALLRGNLINPQESPWGDGKSVIFDIQYTQLLINIKNANLSVEINSYCDLFLSILEIFKKYFDKF